MTIYVNDVIHEMERYAPPVLAFEGDPIGLSLGRRNKPLKAVMVALDLTRAVVEEAVALGAAFIVTHHPAIFHAIHSMTDDVHESETLLLCAEQGIAVYAAHTNADATAEGTGHLMVKRLYPDNDVTSTPLLKLPAHHEPLQGFGRYFSAETATYGVWQKRAVQAFDAPFARLIGEATKEASHVAVWPGSLDESVLPLAMAAGIDLIIAGESKHHMNVAYAERGIGLIVVGHDRSENPFVDHVARRLANAFPELQVATHLDEAVKL